MAKLILASNSPRRRELLAQICKEFTVEPSLFEEKGEGLSARETVTAFARGKAREVFSRFPQADVLGADTVVALGGSILGKPKDSLDACRMLRLLSGREHTVLTGVCLVTPKGEWELLAETKVFFETLTEELIQFYVAGGSPLDKAGAYGIQDGYPLVRSCEGSYTNVMGLPVEETRALLMAHGSCLC